MARIFVTGSRGYLGQSVVHRLSEAGHEVGALTGRLENLPVGGVAAECVVHLAAALRDASPEEIVRTNVDGTQALLRAMTPGTRIVFVSSRAIYGTGRPAPIVTENTTPAPQDVYGQSKLDAERLIAASGHPFVILRPTLLVGAGHASNGRNFINQLIDRALRGAPLHVRGGEQLVDPLPVGDAARHVAAFIECGHWWGHVFNASGPRARVLDIARLIVELASARTGRRAAIDVSAGAEPEGVLLDAAKLAAYSPCRAVTSLPDAVRGLFARWQP